MNRRASVSLQRLLQLLGASAFAIIAVAVVQFAFSAPAEAQDGGSIDQPVLSADTLPDGTVVLAPTFARPFKAQCLKLMQAVVSTRASGCSRGAMTMRLPIS